MPVEPIPFQRRHSDAPSPVKEVHIVWLTAGLSCDGDSVSVTAAEQPSIEDVILGAIPGLPKVYLHNPVLAYENGDDFMKFFYQAERGEIALRSRPFSASSFAKTSTPKRAAIGARGRSVSQLSHTALPWLWGGLIVLLLTGILQTLVEPVRQFVTPMFWAKMTMIPIVATMTAMYAKAVRRNAPAWDAASSRPSHAKLFAVLSTLLWLAIIFCGRFIAYTSSFYT